MKKLTPILLFASALFLFSCSDTIRRENISLNGTWQCTVTESGSAIPESFTGTIPVPGLADMATVKIDSLGLPHSEKRDLWYRRAFQHTPVAGKKVTLKIHKVKFGHTVWVNGQKAGSSNYCFTPAEYDITELLNMEGSNNELVIRVGAFTNNLEEPVIYGADFEKIRYLPGIYDDVELIISGDHRIRNVQVAPDIESDLLLLEVYMPDMQTGELKYRITEKVTGKVVLEGKSGNLSWDSGRTRFEIPFTNYHLWSPEIPFLYKLEVSSENDNYSTTFGMRSFGFDVESGRAELNGETYFMRGTNVCIFRFFEDPERNGLPWDTAWVRSLHRTFKSMHWNSIRYCISVPPRFWYDIADEEGLLIQDEYPVWTGTEGGFARIYPDVTPLTLAEEYHHWMPERWNHPSVVIWDAQNESVTPVIGQAIGIVRELDLSGRPWENGWARPQSPDDPMETHPYRFTRYLGQKAGEEGPLKELIAEPQVPDNGPSERMPPEGGGEYPNPIIINEYGWLWLNRDGSTTTLTDWVYPNAFGKEMDTEERLETYARHLGILTEYWRAHRKAAGVLHFCGLAYSRSGEPRGQTSDHFTDIAALELEPHFVEFVKPAFNPVGLFIDWFELEVAPDVAVKIPVVAINDLNTSHEGTLHLTWKSGETRIEAAEAGVSIEAFGRIDTTFSIQTPSQPGEWELTLRMDTDIDTGVSRRLCKVKT